MIQRPNNGFLLYFVRYRQPEQTKFLRLESLWAIHFNPKSIPMVRTAMQTKKERSEKNPKRQSGSKGCDESRELGQVAESPSTRSQDTFRNHSTCHHIHLAK